MRRSDPRCSDVANAAIAATPAEVVAIIAFDNGDSPARSEPIEPELPFWLYLPPFCFMPVELFH